MTLFGCASKPCFVAGPHPTPLRTPFVAACSYIPLHTFVANAWRWYALQKNLVANQDILLQTYVAEWPPKPVTNPVFLTHSHLTPHGVTEVTPRGKGRRPFFFPPPWLEACRQRGSKNV